MDERKGHMPENHVVAVIGGSSAAESTARELAQHGFDQVVLFHGNEVRETVDAKGTHAGPIEKVVKAVQDHLSEQTNYLAQYEEEARGGNVVLAVHVKDQDELEAVRTILDDAGARNVRFFGKFAVTDLTPESNPSAPSAASPERRSGD
jgi:NAD(P)-dependent dehydrogenase (short-subunit alcohol dehydrogenase family)